jgi:hypothetical protein
MPGYGFLFKNKSNVLCSVTFTFPLDAQVIPWWGSGIFNLPLVKYPCHSSSTSTPGMAHSPGSSFLLCASPVCEARLVQLQALSVARVGKHAATSLSLP